MVHIKVMAEIPKQPPGIGINYLTSTGAEVLPSTVCFSIDTSWVLVLVGKIMMLSKWMDHEQLEPRISDF